MITLYDYRPSQNGYKVRLLLNHLGWSYREQRVAIFEGEGQRPEFLAKNPTGAVPVLELEDGRVLPESNAILGFLAEGTAYLPNDPWARAQVHRWMYFEEDAIQNGLASLRHWTLTGKLTRRSSEAIEGKRKASLRALCVLDRWLTDRPFLTEAGYTIADMCVFAYVSCAGDARIDLEDFPAVGRWIDRVRAQPGFLGQIWPYAIDPACLRELP